MILYGNYFGNINLISSLILVCVSPVLLSNAGLITSLIKILVGITWINIFTICNYCKWVFFVINFYYYSFAV